MKKLISLALLLFISQILSSQILDDNNSKNSTKEVLHNMESIVIKKAKGFWENIFSVENNIKRRGLIMNGDDELTTSPLDFASFWVSGMQGVFTIEWTVYSMNFPNAITYFSISSSGDTAGVTTGLSTPPLGQYFVQAKVTDDNGTWYPNKTFNLVSGSSGFFRESITNTMYSIYPNPSKDIVNIKFLNKNAILESNNPIVGELFDMMGTLKQKFTINSETKINVNQMKTGIYILKIYLGDRIENHQIIVK